jgi:hypothetical protein
MKPVLISTLMFFANICSGQHIPNGSFEVSDKNAPLALQLWESKSVSHLLVDSTSAHEGKQSIKISNTESANTSLYQEFSLAPAGLKKMKLSYFAKATLQSGQANVALIVKDNAGRHIMFRNNNDNPVRSTDQWVERSIIFYTTEEAAKLYISPFLYGKGEAWFDHFELTELPHDETLSTLASNYLNEAMAIIEKHALYSDSVDLSLIRKTAMRIAGNASTTADCYPAVSYMISKLGDRHSSLIVPQRVQLSSSTDKSLITIRQPKGQLLDGNVGYIMLPSFSSSNTELMKDFADSLQQIIASLDAAQPKGWIVDLRQNGGGNCWPMLAGIGPLLGNGECGYFVNKDNSRAAWYYKNGEAGYNQQPVVKARFVYALKSHKTPIAVLTSTVTASSGEVVAVAFKQRKTTHFFGQPTAGLSTGNQRFSLSDGAAINLAVNVYADRTGRLYGKKITPDTEVINTSSGDETLDKALTWIRQY